MSKEMLLKSVALAGGQTQLALAIRSRMKNSKIGQVHIWGWINSVKMQVPPAEVVIAICESVNWQVTPHQLRGDIYPNVNDGMPIATRVAA